MPPLETRTKVRTSAVAPVITCPFRKEIALQQKTVRSGNNGIAVLAPPAEKTHSVQAKSCHCCFLFAVLAMQSPPADAAEAKYFPLQPGEHPHDVAPAPDGTVWYTGQRTGVLGRLDPKTGTVERIPLGKNSAPHGVIVGPDGAAWVTDGGQNAIVRVDPG